MGILRSARKLRNLLVLAAAGISLIVYIFVSREQLVGALAISLIASFVGLAFVDDSVARNRERERTRVTRIALNSIKSRVNHVTICLANWYKVSTRNVVEPLPDTFEAFFDEPYFEMIRHFNVWADSHVSRVVAQNLVQLDWMTFNGELFERFRTELNGVVDKYASYFDSELLDLLEDLSGSELTDTVAGAWSADIRNVRRKAGASADEWCMFASSARTEAVSDFVKLLMKLRRRLEAFDVEVCTISDSRLAEPDRPTVASARVEQVHELT